MAIALRPRLAANAAKSTSGRFCDSANFGEPAIARISHVTWFRSLLCRIATIRRGSSHSSPVPLDRDQLGHAVHLHGAVTDERDDGPLRVTELGADRVRHAGAHGRESARQRSPHVAAELAGCRAYQLAADPESAVTMASSGSFGESSENSRMRVDRVGADLRLLVHGFPPAGHVLLDALTPRPVLFAAQLRDQSPQRGLRVGDQVDLVRVAHADHAGRRHRSAPRGTARTRAGTACRGSSSPR